ncbi:MAG: FKBP-type peptidyl-prolyl cis-trans isomerase [Acidobacteria bacterium]|nr:FKBP-type peptidyl-prolyl cis-trans isomerase [Acidobacteriota bacterium]
MPQSRKRRTPRRSHTSRASFGAQENRAQRHSKQRRTRLIAIVVIVALAAAALAYLFVPGLPGRAGAEVTTPSGLKYTDITVGTGESPSPGRTAVVHYTGTLLNGTKFDSSRDRGQPMSFVFKRQPMIPGWEEGVSTMKVGGRRRLVVPPALGYGPQGKPPDIPPNSTLVFDIELLDVK